jgi:hypothetical protein
MVQGIKEVMDGGGTQARLERFGQWLASFLACFTSLRWYSSFFFHVSDLNLFWFFLNLVAPSTFLAFLWLQEL